MQSGRLTTKQVVYGAKFLFGLMADKYTGRCTLHQLMLLNALFVCAVEGQHCTFERLVDITKINKKSARRSVKRLLARGHLVAKPDPDDARRKLYYIGSRITRSPNDIELIKDAFQKHY